MVLTLRKELLRWNKKHFSTFSKDFQLPKLVSDLRVKNVAKVCTIFKARNTPELSNYRPMSVQPFFSKILKCVMKSGLYKYLLDSNIPCKKRFCFQDRHLTDHVILQLLNLMLNNFIECSFTLGVFTDLSLMRWTLSITKYNSKN